MRNLMNNTTRLFASIVFIAISIFLVFYTWLPARDSLQREEAKITNIISLANTWYEVEITTSNGNRIACRTRHGWPLLGPNRCPLEKLQDLQGQNMTVAHDGKRPYEIMVDNKMVIDFNAHRKAQITALAFAGLMLSMAILVWKLK